MLWPQSPAIAAAELPAILDQHRVVVVHCWAPWNHYDKWLDATLWELKPRYADRITFFARNVDLEVNHEFLQRHQILNIPALVCFLNGRWHETAIGDLGKRDLTRKLDAWLAAGGSEPPSTRTPPSARPSNI
jgi:thiol-disulfide isomerase/thioredoxin